MELLSNKTYSKEIGLTTKLESYIQYIIVFSKVLLMNTKEKVEMTSKKDPKGGNQEEERKGENQGEASGDT